MFNRSDIGFNRKAKWDRIIGRVRHASQFMSANVHTRLEFPVCLYTRVRASVYFRTRLEVVKELVRIGG